MMTDEKPTAGQEERETETRAEHLRSEPVAPPPPLAEHGGLFQDATAATMESIPAPSSQGTYSEPPQRDSKLLSASTTISLFDSEALAPIFFGFLFLSTIVGVYYVMQLFVADLVIAFILIGLFHRIFEWLCDRLGGHKWLASGTVTLGISLLLFLPLLGLGYMIAEDATESYIKVSSIFAGADGPFSEQIFSIVESSHLPITRETLFNYVDRLVIALQQVAVGFGTQLFSNILAITIHGATVLVMVFYMLVDGVRVRKFFFALSPLPDDEDAMILETFRKVSRGVIVGNGLGSLIQGVLGGIAMGVVGFSAPIFWGAVMTLFAFLPLVGVSVVAVPASVVLLVQGQTAEAFSFLGFCILQGLFVENVVKTKLMGSAMRMHDLLVFMSILGGMSAFGVLGIVYGPLIMMLFSTLHDLYDRRYRPQMARRFAQHFRANR